MIPDLAIMISAYIGFRMIEVFLFAPNRYSSPGARICVCVLAVIAFLVSGITAVSILTSGPNIPH
jgi:hypothetical protein